MKVPEICIHAIFAQSKNGIIGDGANIPWRVKGEQQIFKSTTAFQKCIVGRTTYEDVRGLPDRSFIVLSHSKSYEVNEGDVLLHSVEEVLEYLRVNNIGTSFVIGGGEVYRQFMPYTSVVHRSTIDIEVEGDVFAPTIGDNMVAFYKQGYTSNEHFTYEIFLDKDTL